MNSNWARFNKYLYKYWKLEAAIDKAYGNKDLKLFLILAIVFYLNWKLALFASLLVPFTYIQPYLY